MLEPNSPLADFYPEEVELDPNGKAMPWLWVVLLPFIDEERLLGEMKYVYPRFDEEVTHRHDCRTPVSLHTGKRPQPISGRNNLCSPDERWRSSTGHSDAP